MKKTSILLTLSISLSLYGAPATIDLVDAQPDSPQEEIVALEPSFTTQPITSEELPAPPPLSYKKSTFVAVTLSALLPGLGHLYLGEKGTAAGLAGSASLGYGLTYAPDSRGNAQIAGFTTVQNTWLYGIFAAYRDTRNHNGQSNYSYKMPTDTLTDLAYAPFNFRILKKPEVWGGILGSLAAAVTATYFALPKKVHKEAHMPALSTRRITPVLPLAALPIGIGEEAFFRGYLQSALAEETSPWGGIALSSLAFAAVHIPNALTFKPGHRWRYYAFNLPLITAMGTYFGWLTRKNCSLKESVAIHTWYDFTLFTTAVLATQAATMGSAEFAVAIPF